MPATSKKWIFHGSYHDGLENGSIRIGSAVHIHHLYRTWIFGRYHRKSSGQKVRQSLIFPSNWLIIWVLTRVYLIGVDHNFRPGEHRIPQWSQGKHPTSFYPGYFEGVFAGSCLTWKHPKLDTGWQRKPFNL